MSETPSSEQIGAVRTQLDQASSNDRAARLDKMLATATNNVSYHSGETILRGEFSGTKFSLLKNAHGYSIAMACSETSLQIDMALSGEVLKSEESLQNPKLEPRPYANVDGLIGVIENEIS